MQNTQKGTLVLASALAALTGVLAPAAAAAAAPQGNSTEQTAAARAEAARYTGEARAAGLSNAQISTLQQDLATYLTQHGGKAVAANKVANRDGSTTLFPLPGEKFARELNSGVNGNDAKAAAAGCQSGAFCAYKSANYAGTVVKYIRCGTYEIPDGWNSGGSWINNQTSSLQAVMRNKRHQPVYVTPPAYSSDRSGDWGPVWFITNC